MSTAVCRFRRAPIGPRLYTAVIKYAAPFAGDPDGLTGFNTTAIGMLTQFEPLAARKAFPGFDTVVPRPSR